jgi:hypothetical protein
MGRGAPDLCNALAREDKTGDGGLMVGENLLRLTTFVHRRPGHPVSVAIFCMRSSSRYGWCTGTRSQGGSRRSTSQQ